MDRSLQGRRVRLVHTGDIFTDLKPGALGTIQFVDNMGTTHIAWDSGSRLGMLKGEDRFDLLPEGSA